MFVFRKTIVLALMTASLGLRSPSAIGGFIYASGQMLVENGPGGHDDTRENRIFRIDPATGVAESASPLFTGSTPPALAGTASGKLLGLRSGRLGRVDIAAGVFDPFGSALGVNATGFDILSDGRGFLLPFDQRSQTQQLFSIDTASAAIAPIGSSDAIGAAIDAAAGQSPGTSAPFVISLGSVGNSLYGIDLDSYSLIRIDPDSGVASVVGSVGAVGRANGGGYTGFAGLTGVDTDSDGAFDALYGAVNFGPGGERLGGIARFDLNDGDWSLVATNPGLIYFGMGSSVVPEPASFTLIGLGLVALGVGRRIRRK